MPVTLRSKCYCFITKNSGATESLVGIVLKPRGNRFSNDRSAIRAVECAVEVYETIGPDMNKTPRTVVGLAP